MEFKISSVFLPHSFACFLEFFSIVFFFEHCEFKKKDGSSKICSNFHFSKLIFLLIRRVSWAVNGTEMEFKTSSVFLPHSLACFLDFLSIVFFLEHSEFKKKMDHRKYSENLIFQIVVHLGSWTLFKLLMALNCSLTSPLTFYPVV